MKGRKKSLIAATVVMSSGLISAVMGVVPPAASAAVNAVTIPMPAMQSLDPTQWGGQILVDQGTILEGLVGYNTKNQLVPKIATHWSVSDGGRVWTFFLRHNAKWSNGQAVTANDFYYAWMRLASPQDSTGALWAGVMSNVLNAWAYHAGGVPASAVGLKVINPYELQLTLGAPHNILGELPLAGSMPVNEADVKAHPTNWYLPQYFVGDGPYVVKSFIPNGAISIVRNPKYVGAPGQVNFGNVQQINFIPAPTVPVEDYMANKMDAAVIGNPSDFQYIQTHANLKPQLHVASIANVTYLEWDHSTDASPMDNTLVRQALALAIDRTPIANAVLNKMAIPAMKFAYPGWPTYKYENSMSTNIAKAKALLAKAGYPNGKGMPTLYLYSQTQANSPASVSIAEALAQEWKQNLNVNFKIDPLAATLWGNVVWQGLNPGIHPGFVIANGVANWSDPSNYAMQANQLLIWAGTIGPVQYREHLSNWYFPTYDPQSVAKFGNPDDASMGVTWSQWAPLVKAAEADIKYLAAWTAKQPPAYRALLTVPGAQTPQQIWDNYVAGWKAAKTPADKHAAWVAAWKDVGNYSAGNGDPNIGLDGQVYVDEHQPTEVYQMNMWNTIGSASSSATVSAQLAGKIVNKLMADGYTIPLFFNEQFYLEKPYLHGVQTNPWSWNNFYQLQYMRVN